MIANKLIMYLTCAYLKKGSNVFNILLLYEDEDFLLLFHDGDRYHTETSPLICGAKSMDWFLYDNCRRHENRKVF